MTGGDFPRVANVNTRRAILEELRISRRVICTGDELTPRLYVYSPSGIYLALIPLPENEDKRRDLLWHARLFMVWKAVTGFILSTEIKDSRRHHGYAGDARRSNGSLAATYLPRSCEICGARLVWARGRRAGNYRPPAREVRAADCRRDANNRGIRKRHCARTDLVQGERRRIKAASAALATEASREEDVAVRRRHHLINPPDLRSFHA